MGEKFRQMREVLYRSGSQVGSLHGMHRTAQLAKGQMIMDVNTYDLISEGMVFLFLGWLVWRGSRQR